MFQRTLLSCLLIIHMIVNLNEVHGIDADSDFCHDKQPGFYADAASNCTGFYNCPQLLRQSLRLPCVDNRSFDVATCTCRHRIHANDSWTCAASDNPCTPTSSSSSSTTTTTTAAPPSDTFSCTNRREGLYPALSDRCRSYFSCTTGSASPRYACPSSQAFDHYTCTCLPEVMVHCKLGDDERPCRRPPSPTTRQPRPTTSTTISPTPPPSTFCNGRHAGYYPDVSRDCEWFFVCQGGNFLTAQLQCPSYLRFDPRTCRCEYPFNVACTVLDGLTPCDPNPVSTTPATTTTTTRTTTTPPPRPMPPHQFCEGRRAGFYAYRDLSCEYFYSCVDGHGQDRLYRCVKGYRFDQRQEACRPKEQVPCLPLDGPVELLV